jgi:hypothetical protein
MVGSVIRTGSALAHEERPRRMAGKTIKRRPQDRDAALASDSDARSCTTVSENFLRPITTLTLRSGNGSPDARP